MAICYIQNMYMNTIQKAFVNGIPGCTEHHCKLASIIKRSHKRIQVTVCVLARPTYVYVHVENTYWNVPHGLIQFVYMQYYNTPSQFTSVYGITTTFTVNSWSTLFIPLQKGDVHQGDSLSVVIFNTVKCTLIDALKPLQHLG